MVPLALILLHAAPAGEPLSPAEAAYRCAIVRGDPERLSRIVRERPEPRYLAALFEVWPWEAPDPDAEFGEPLARRLLAAWRRGDPQNPLPVCLEAWRGLLHEHAFPDLDALAARMERAGPFRYHYLRFRRDALDTLWARKGNAVRTWEAWLGAFGHANLLRVHGVTTLFVREAHYRILKREPERAEARLRAAERIVALHEKAAARDDQVAWQAALDRAAIARERVLAALFAGDVRAAGDRIRFARKTLEDARGRAGRARFLGGLAAAFARGIETAELDLRAPGWADIVGVTPEKLARFRDRFRAIGFGAVDEIWSYAAPEVPDDTRDLEDHLDVLTESPLSRAAAVRFVEYMQEAIAKRRPLAAWVNPLTGGGRAAFPRAAALGRRRLKPAEERFFRVFTGAIEFLQGDLSHRAEWIENFRRGATVDLGLVAFARHGIREAIPAVIERFRGLSERLGPFGALDYYFVLRDLSGVDKGLDADRWREWLLLQTG